MTLDEHREPKPGHREILELEAQYGKHNFCYQCGSPNIKPMGESYSFAADGSPAMY